MNAPVNCNFEDHLVRLVEVEGEIWFVGKDVCAVLGIQKHHQALETLDDDERGTCNVGTPRGEQSMIVVSEPGVYRLVFRSRKPEAERFKRWLAHEVLPQIRRTGAYSAEGAARQAEADAREALDTDAPLAARIDAVRVARSIYGKEGARALWVRLGLPQLYPDRQPEQSEALAVLDRILDHAPYGADRSVRHLILDALDGDEAARLALLAFGVRPSEETDGFWLANATPAIRALFAGTAWSDGSWRTAIRRLPGARPGERAVFAGMQSRTTWLPALVLDRPTGTLH